MNIRESIKRVINSGCTVEYVNRGNKLTLCLLSNYVPEENMDLYQVDCDHNRADLRFSQLYRSLGKAIEQFVTLKMAMENGKPKEINHDLSKL